VPPYRFDITPFLGLLNDGQPHEIAAKVFGQGEGGTWFIDMVLVGSYDAHFAVLGGRLLEHVVEPPVVRVSHPNSTDEYRVNTEGGSALRVTGLLEPVGGGGTALVTTVQARLRAHNENHMGRDGDPAGGKCRLPCLTTPPPLASLGHLRAHAAPMHSGAPPEQLGSSPWPQQLAAGRPKVQCFATCNHQATSRRASPRGSWRRSSTAPSCSPPASRRPSRC
jgi:hypothetical protein